MAPCPPPAPGAASGPPAPPLDPRAMDALLQHHPARAAAVLASLRPPQRYAQLLAHAAIVNAPPARMQVEWADLLRLARPTSDDDPLPASVIEPERLALMTPDEARDAVAALSPAQRVAQAVAQAAWLGGFGYPVAVEELLALWAVGDERTAA